MKSKLLFLDVETTGLDAEDRLCEVAYVADHGGKIWTSKQQYFKAPVKVKIGAMAVNHITNYFLAHKKPFANSQMEKELIALAKDDYILVAHNAPFDLRMLEKEGVVFKRYIDTKKLSHALDKDDTMESHRMQYLRYYHNVRMKGDDSQMAHTAEGDTAVLRKLYYKLVDKLGKPTIAKQLKISETPVLFNVFKFGKYRGTSIGKVAAIKPQYLEWLLAEKRKSEQDETDWIYTLEYHLENR